MKNVAHVQLEMLAKLLQHSDESEKDLIDLQSIHESIHLPKFVFNLSSKFTMLIPRHSLVESNTLEEIKIPMSTFWLNINCPDITDLSYLAKIFQIHELSLCDILEQDAIREKCDLFENHVFITLKTYYTYFYFFLFENGLLSIQTQLGNHPINVMKRIERSHDEIGGDWILYLFFDDIIDGFVHDIKSIHSKVTQLDENIMENDQKDYSLQSLNILKRLNELIQIVQNKKKVVRSFMKKAQYIQKETNLYLLDMLDRLSSLDQKLQNDKESLRILQEINTFRKILNQAKLLMDNNEKMNLLELIGMVFTPLNFISGYLGINVLVPYDVRHAQYLEPFFCVCFLCFLLSIKLINF